MKLWVCFFSIILVYLFNIPAFANIVIKAPKKVHVGQPIPVRIEGLGADQVTIRVFTPYAKPIEDSTSVKGVGISEAIFKPEKGVVDLSRQAPVSGVYHGVNPAGLFFDQFLLGQNYLPKQLEEIGKKVRTVNPDTHVKSRNIIITVTKKDRLLAVKKIALRNDDFFKVTVLETPYQGFLITQKKESFPKIEKKAKRKMGVIYFPGSKNRLPLPMLYRLATQGFPVFMYKYRRDKACFDNIPIENSIQAARWFIKKYQLDEVILFGTSKGVEAAVLTAAQNQLPIGGVILMSGAGYLMPGSEGLSCYFTTSSWSVRNQPLPYVNPTWKYHYLLSSLYHMDQRTAYERAIKKRPWKKLEKVLLPADRINAPLLVFGSNKDRNINSVWGAKTICRLAKCDQYPSRHIKLFDNAEHDIMGTGWFPSNCDEPKHYHSRKECRTANGKAAYQAMQIIEDFLKEIENNKGLNSEKVLNPYLP